ncbi:competence protein CoiA family protein [Pseudarthrobacter sp. NPDC089323]
MKRAKCLLDGQDWDAQEFSQQDIQWQQPRRKMFVCLACNGPAAYRAGSKRKPSFAAQHDADCQLKSKQWSVFRFLQ